MFEEVRARLVNIFQSYPRHMDIILNELNEVEKQITQLRAEVERLKPLAEIGEAIKKIEEQQDQFVNITWFEHCKECGVSHDVSIDTQEMMRQYSLMQKGE